MKERERERTTREFPHNSRLCSFEYHSFHSFKRSTLKELFLFFPSLSLSLLCYFLLLLVFLLIFSSSLLLPSLSLSLASFNYMKRDSTRGRCDKRGNNDERRIVLSLSKLEEGGVPLFLLPSPFSRFFLRFFSPRSSERVEEREYTPVRRLIWSNEKQREEKTMVYGEEREREREIKGWNAKYLPRDILQKTRDNENVHQPPPLQSIHFESRISPLPKGVTVMEGGFSKFLNTPCPFINARSQ